jgi:hypothetical protein
LRILPRWGFLRAGELFPLPTPERLTGGSGSGLWLTPTAEDFKQPGKKEIGMMRIYETGTNVPDTYKRLRSQVAARMWPTPQTTDANNACLTEKRLNRSEGMQLREAARVWPTPTAGDSKSACNLTANRSDSNSKHHSGTTLTDAVRLPVPTANRRDGLQSHGVNVVSGV